MSAVVLGKLRAGFRRGSKVRPNEQLQREFLSRPRVRMVDVDEGTSERYAVIYDDLRRRGRPVSVNDLWIAAPALQHGLRLLWGDSTSRRRGPALEVLETVDRRRRKRAGA